MRKTFELEVHPQDERCPIVWIVWCGLKSIPVTHNIYSIRTAEEDAIKTVDGGNSREQDYQKEPLEFWYERAYLNHAFGEQCVNRARQISRSLRTGD